MRLPAAVALVALGGAAGTYARVAASMVLPEPALASTLVVNLLGAFALGVLTTRLAGDGPRRRGARLLLGTGFCGGLTTYSLVALQSAMLLQNGDAIWAVLYCAATLVWGAIATLVGVALAARRRPGRATAVRGPRP